MGIKDIFLNNPIIRSIMTEKVSSKEDISKAKEINNVDNKEEFNVEEIIAIPVNKEKQEVEEVKEEKVEKAKVAETNEQQLIKEEKIEKVEKAKVVETSEQKLIKEEKIEKVEKAKVAEINEQKLVEEKTINEPKKPKQKNQKQTVYLEYGRHMINRLEKEKSNMYVKMQNEDYIARKEAIERWDKLEALIENLNKCLIIINDKNADNNDKKKSEELLKSMCERFKKLEEKEKNHTNGNSER